MELIAEQTPDHRPQEMDEISSTERAEIEKQFIEKFSPRTYIDTYFSEKAFSIKSDRVLEIIGELYKMKGEKEKPGEINFIDVNVLAERCGIIGKEEKIDLEEIILYEFQLKTIIHLLETYPQDQIEILDVGAGPTIYQDIIMCLTTNSITHSEFLEQNRVEAIKWLKGEKDSFNWDAYFTLIKTILKNNNDYRELLGNLLKNPDENIQAHAQKITKILDEENGIENFKKHLRDCIGDKVIPGNVFQPDLGLGDDFSIKQFDVINSSTSQRAKPIQVIMSNFGIESATDKHHEMELALTNIDNMIKPGGFFLATMLRNADSYKVGEHKLPATKTDEGIIIDILKNKLGYKIINCQVITGLDKENLGYDGDILIFAQKQSQKKEDNNETS